MWHAVTLQLSNSPELPPMLQETKVSIHHQYKPRQTHLEFTYSMTKFKSTRMASILATSVSLRSRPYLFWTCFSSKFPAKQDLLACVGVIAGKCRDSTCLNWFFFHGVFSHQDRHGTTREITCQAVPLHQGSQRKAAMPWRVDQWSKTDPIIQIWLDWFELQMKNLMLPDKHRKALHIPLKIPHLKRRFSWSQPCNVPSSRLTTFSWLHGDPFVLDGLHLAREPSLQETFAFPLSLQNAEVLKVKK